MKNIAVLIWDDFQQLGAHGRAKTFDTEAAAADWAERQDARCAEIIAFSDEASAAEFAATFRDYCYAAWTPNQGSQFQELLDVETPASRLDELRSMGVPVE